MKRLFIALPTNIAPCRSCGAPIEWASTVDGSRLPFNPPIRFVPQLDDLADHVAEVDRAATVSHFATCPDAAAWRRTHSPAAVTHRR